MRRRPRRRPHLRNERPALCDTTSAAPARTCGTRPPDKPRSNVPDRTATNGRSRAEGTSGPRASVPASVLSMHLKSRRQRAAPEPPRPEPSPTPATRVAADPQSVTTDTCCMATRRANRQTPTTLTLAVGPNSPRDRLPLARQNPPQDTSGAFTRHRRRRDRRNRHAAPGLHRGPEQLRLPQCRVRFCRAAWNPSRSSTASANSPRPCRSTTSDVQASFRAAVVVPAIHLPVGPAGALPAGDAPDRDGETLICIFRVNDAVGLSAAACSTPPAIPISGSDSTPGTGTVGAEGGCSAATPAPRCCVPRPRS